MMEKFYFFPNAWSFLGRNLKSYRKIIFFNLNTEKKNIDT